MFSLYRYIYLYRNIKFIYNIIGIILFRNNNQVEPCYNLCCIMRKIFIGKGVLLWLIFILFSPT